ncbi:MAG: gliding motility-associated C-terminal domain-containing protein, partial [Bacteroidota bacterium]
TWFNDGEQVGQVTGDNTYPANAGGSWRVNITTTDPNFCPGSARLPFIMGETQRPDPSIIPSQPGQLCSGDTLMLTYLPRGAGYEHFWQFVGSMQTSTEDTIYIWETDSVELVLEHDICENFDTVLTYEIIVNPTPEGYFTFTPEPAYQNTPVAFTPHLNDSSFIDSTLQYAWYFTGDSPVPDIITQDTVTEWSFDEFDADSKEVEVVLEFISSIGRTQCTHRDTDTVRILPQFLWIPTAFSPNSDGLNDYWDIYSEVIVPESFNVQIFNRWGIKVAELTANDFNRKDSGWDGRDQESGEACPEGVYVYVLKGQTVPNDRGVPQEFYRTGSVTIIR